MARRGPYWTRRRIIEAFRTWGAHHKRAPMSKDLRTDRTLPVIDTVLDVFGSLAIARRQAGFAPGFRGHGGNRSTKPVLMTPRDFQDWRQRRQWTQARCAAYLGVSASLISRYERGKAKITSPQVYLRCLEAEAAGRKANAKPSGAKRQPRLRNTKGE